jgi:predicted branched-subunit amino acid permease
MYDSPAIYPALAAAGGAGAAAAAATHNVAWAVIAGALALTAAAVAFARWRGKRKAIV